MPISASNYDGTSSYTIAEMRDLANPNILLNSDYKNGIVNQIGDSSTTSTNNLKLTIDGWYLRAKSGKLTVNSKSITIESLAKNDSDLELYFHQNIPVINSGETVTIYVNVASLSGSGKAYVSLQDSSGSTSGPKTLQQGENEFTVSTSKAFEKFLIYFEGLVKMEISQMKLEKSGAYTGMPHFDISQEIERCKVYLLRLKSYADVFAGKSDSSGLVFTIPTTIQMYKDPTQSVKSNIMVFNSTGSKRIVSPNLECQVTPIGIRCIYRQNISINGNVNVVFEGNVLFDANK